MPSKLPIKKQQSLNPVTLDYSKIKLPDPIPNEPICRACNDTGVSSSGMPCHPCTVRKRINTRENTYVPTRKIVISNKPTKTPKKAAPPRKK